MRKKKRKAKVTQTTARDYFSPFVLLKRVPPQRRSRARSGIENKLTHSSPRGRHTHTQTHTGKANLSDDFFYSTVRGSRLFHFSFFIFFPSRPFSLPSFSTVFVVVGVVIYPRYEGCCRLISGKTRAGLFLQSQGKGDDYESGPAEE